MEATVKVDIGMDGNRKFIEHGLDLNPKVPDAASMISRYYNEEVDKQIIQNMPDGMLKSLDEKIQEEKKRREGLS